MSDSPENSLWNGDLPAKVLELEVPFKAVQPLGKGNLVLLINQSLKVICLQGEAMTLANVCLWLKGMPRKGIS